jgi:hypothetical protein
MANDLSLKIKRSFDTKLKEKLKPSVLNSIARKVALKELELIRERTMAGLDVNGKRFTAYTPKYRETKRAYISSRRKGKPKTEWAAKKIEDFMRFSGRTFSDMTVKGIKVGQVKGEIRLQYDLGFRSKRSENIARYHSKLGVGAKKTIRNFWGALRDAKRLKMLQDLTAKELKKVL